MSIRLWFKVWFVLQRYERFGYRDIQPMVVVDIIKSDSAFGDDIVVKYPLLSEQRFIRWW